MLGIKSAQQTRLCYIPDSNVDASTGQLVVKLGCNIATAIACLSARTMAKCFLILASTASTRAMPSPDVSGVSPAGLSLSAGASPGTPSSLTGGC